MSLSQPSPEASTCRLSALGNGEAGVVVCVHDSALLSRLAARGLVPGASFEVLRGGDPMLLRQDDSRWALAAPEAQQVEVERQPSSARWIPAFLRRLLSA